MRKTQFILLLSNFLITTITIAQMRPANQSLFNTPGSSSIELGGITNFFIKTPPFQVPYFGINVYAKWTKVFTPKWSFGSSIRYSSVLKDELNIEKIYPPFAVRGDVFARYMLIDGAHNAIYLESGPSLATVRYRNNPRRYDSGIFPFWSGRLGGLLKVKDGWYVHFNTGIHLPLDFKSTIIKDIGIGASYYFHDRYTEYNRAPKNYGLFSTKLRPKFEYSVGFGFYPFPADAFAGRPYYMYMFTGKIGRHLNRTFTAGLMTLLELHHAAYASPKFFASAGPYIQSTFFRHKPYQLNIYTGVLFSNNFLPEAAEPFHEFVLYVPIGFGVTKKLFNWKEGLYFDFTLTFNNALYSPRRIEGNGSFFGIGLKQDIVSK